MAEIHGNLEGIRKTALDQMKTLYDWPVEADEFIPQELVNILCRYSAAMNREVGVYITRDGEIADIMIGYADHIDLTDMRLRRSERRLSRIRCIHTHPRATGHLSEVDLSALKSMRFDAMCAIGVSPDGKPGSVQCAFLDAGHGDGVSCTELLPLRRLPQREWMDTIDMVDRGFETALSSNEPECEQAVLIGIESEESLAELQELAQTAGAKTLLRILQKRPKPDSATFIGKGKAERLSLDCQAIGADLVIVDDELTGAMQKNLEEILHIKVIDRTTLILDIFAGRAQSREGKLQVEMAQLQYRSQRLLGQGVVMSRLAGGIGTRGPGESKLEVNRRRIRERLTELRRELDEIDRQRNIRRKNREKKGIPIVALAGYTNAGKSTLFNRLTGAGVYVEDQLFATLDATSRPFELTHGEKALLIDTVGFIRKLPHGLVQAFRSTLEEVRLADVIVLVCDGSDPEAAHRIDTVREVLNELEAGDLPCVIALNKMDQPGFSSEAFPEAVCLSALTGGGIPELLEAVEQKLHQGIEEIQLLLPFASYGLVQKVREGGSLLSEEYGENGVCIRARMRPELKEQLLRAGAKILAE